MTGYTLSSALVFAIVTHWIDNHVECCREEQHMTLTHNQFVTANPGRTGKSVRNKSIHTYGNRQP